MLSCSNSICIEEQPQNTIEVIEGNCNPVIIEIGIAGPQGIQGEKGDTFVPEGGNDNDVLLKNGELPVYGDVKEANTVMNPTAWYTLAKNGDI